MSVVDKAQSGAKTVWAVVVILVIVAAVGAVMKTLGISPADAVKTLMGWVSNGWEIVKEVWEAIKSGLST